MGKKFDAVYESVIQRYQTGGYLSGDIVVFRPEYKSSPSYKLMPSKIRAEIDELANSGINIKVIQVGNNLSGVGSGGQPITPQNAVIVVGGDHGGGRIYGQVAVSPDMVDLADNDSTNLPKIPDQFRRKDNTTFKPEKFSPDPKHISRVTDKGNGKNTPTNLSLASGVAARNG